MNVQNYLEIYLLLQKKFTTEAWRHGVSRSNTLKNNILYFFLILSKHKTSLFIWLIWPPWNSVT